MTFLIFLSSICIILPKTLATDAIHSTSATNMSSLKDSTTSSTTDTPPGVARNLAEETPEIHC